MRLTVGGVLLALLFAASGCGGGSPNAVVRITVSDSGGTALALAQAKANGREAPLSSVEPLVPRRLPVNLAQNGRCNSNERVTIQLASGKTIAYGPCRLPRTIGWLAGAV